ncbi:MAG: hypothetical protein IT427_12450 [Pirellulales bacterium]|nr:hypothetical protein [Pirellulales bacterium]
MAKKKLARTPKTSKNSPPSARPTKTSPSLKSSANTEIAAGQNGKPTGQNSAVRPKLLPTGDELKSLYDRYTSGTKFDDHDKAFYFVLDVGGLSRAKQLVAHVEEVLAELEEFH